MALALDGSNSAGLQAGGGVTLNLTTSNSNDIVFAVSAGNGQTTAVSGGGLSWAQRALAHQSSGNWWVTVWWALAASPLAAAAITFTWTSTNVPYVFGVSGASVFDPSGVLPVQALADPATYSTSGANDFIFAAISEGVSNPALPAGFTDIARQTGSFSRLAYQISNTSQTNQSVGFGVNANAAVVVDAVTAPASLRTATLLMPATLM